jgi:hypothetical protein
MALPAPDEMRIHGLCLFRAELVVQIFPEVNEHLFTIHSTFPHDVLIFQALHAEQRDPATGSERWAGS